ENRIKKVHLYLSRNFNFIEYYLTNFTFPNDIKHYEKKLTGNAHTLAEEGRTKGFSGIDDRIDTMPESGIPERLSSQKGTNGKMLHILSRKINNKYISITDIFSTKDILDNDNKIMVILRDGESLLLSTCHIDNKELFVYLDEIHTREADLKLPLVANGIVTLGKNMSKDKLMQTVMRLRDLNFKQSMVFWGSKEISAEIAIINDIKLDDITSKHVLAWVTYNTIRKNENDLYLVTKEKLKYVIKSRAV
ncbi:unnamed protein product, partial [Rotaria sordida]